MRATLMIAMLLPGLLLSAKPASSEESAAADATPATESATAKKEEFTVPPGFRTKKRGKYVLYCRREDVIGTRFQAEKCYNESGVQEIVRAQREDQQRVDQMRKICGSLEACGGG